VNSPTGALQDRNVGTFTEAGCIGLEGKFQPLLMVLRSGWWDGKIKQYSALLSPCFAIVSESLP